MAKQIQPVNIWINGEMKEGKFFSVNCIFDNYENQATNYWQIFDSKLDEEGNEVVNSSLASGNLSIGGEDYIMWGDQPAMAINDWIYNWVADKLNLTII
jgi:hypothetical protein